MVKRIVFACLWAFAFLFGSCVLIGFAGAAQLLFLAYTGANPTSNVMYDFVHTWSFVPMILGPLGLIVGLLGFLPGTRRRKK